MSSLRRITLVVALGFLGFSGSSCEATGPNVDHLTTPWPGAELGQGAVIRLDIVGSDLEPASSLAVQVFASGEVIARGRGGLSSSRLDQARMEQVWAAAERLMLARPLWSRRDETEDEGLVLRQFSWGRDRFFLCSLTYAIGLDEGRNTPSDQATIATIRSLFDGLDLDSWVRIDDLFGISSLLTNWEHPKSRLDSVLFNYEPAANESED